MYQPDRTSAATDAKLHFMQPSPANQRGHVPSSLGASKPDDTHPKIRSNKIFTFLRKTTACRSAGLRRRPQSASAITSPQDPQISKTTKTPQKKQSLLEHFFTGRGRMYTADNVRTTLKTKKKRQRMHLCRPRTPVPETEQIPQSSTQANTRARPPALGTDSGPETVAAAAVVAKYFFDSLLTPPGLLVGQFSPLKTLRSADAVHIWCVRKIGAAFGAHDTCALPGSCRMAARALSIRRCVSVFRAGGIATNDGLDGPQAPLAALLLFFAVPCHATSA